MGSKGGFVVKTPTKTREEFQIEGIECYKTFIRGLLDITDNRIGDKIIRPENVVCRDEEDPYCKHTGSDGRSGVYDARD